MPGKKAFDPTQRRRAINAFMATRPDLTVNGWCLAAGVRESTLRNFRNGDSDSLSDRTYGLLAEAAGTTVGVLRGEVAPRLQVPIRARIGAGDQVYPLPGGDDELDSIEAPIPGVDEALQVDGDSMRPLYGPRDLLFPLRNFKEPRELVGRIVAAQIKDGPRVVKLLKPGKGRNRWTLVSLNPGHGDFEDQLVERVALIGAAIYRE